MDSTGVQSAAWCAVSAVFWLIVVRFVMTRWQSVAMGVRANIDRFNQIDAERRQRDAVALLQRSGCARCSASTVANGTTTAPRPNTIQRISGSTVTESDTDPQPKKLLEVRNKQRLAAATRRRITISTAGAETPSSSSSTDLTSTAEGKILKLCRTQSLVSRLTQKFERNCSPSRASATPSNDARPPAKLLVYEKTDVFTVHDDPAATEDEMFDADEPTTTPTPAPVPFQRRTRQSAPPRSRSSAADVDMGMLRRSMSDLLAECERSEVQLRRRSCEMLDDDDGGDHSSSSDHLFEEVLRQERFSKCFSEYSISDLLKEMTAEEDVDADLASMLSMIT